MNKCRDCKYWLVNDNDLSLYPGPNLGMCQKIDPVERIPIIDEETSDDDIPKDILAAAFADDIGQPLITRAEFGCILWLDAACYPSENKS